MPAEEMDIITDVSHSGPAEDIDLDLDDAVAHTDDDMELGDYNEQQGAMDAIDELMAEGDDASDGMVDVDEIDYNISAVANNDYDIDISGTDGNPFEMANAAPNVEINLTDEIEYADAVNTEPTDLAQAQSSNDDIWLQDQDLIGGDAAEADATQMEDTPIEHGEPAPVSQVAHAIAATADFAAEATILGTAHAEAQPDEVTNNDVHQAESAEGRQDELEDFGGNFDDEQPASGHVGTGSDENSNDRAADQKDNTFATLPTESDNQTEHPHELANAASDTVEVAEDGNVDGAVEVVEVTEVAEVAAAPEATEAPETTEATETSWAVEAEAPATSWAEEAEVPETDEAPETSWAEEAPETGWEEEAEGTEAYEVVENSEAAKTGEMSEAAANGEAEARAGSVHNDAAEDDEPYGGREQETDANENPSDGHVDPAPAGTVEAGANADADADNHSPSSRLPHTQITTGEHPSAIAARYGIVIHYGANDYQLFAKSVDDDPERYFLSDRSTLDSTLLEFLASIRDVISQEVSPLDELVMHIDGLGLEFGETTTRDFLERYTFGDMLALYDQLIRNENVDDTLELYVYLLVRPSCSQRLAALVDQANSGRGLVDVAVYRDTTPVPDDGALQGEDRVLAISPDIAVDEFFGDFDEDSSQEPEPAQHQEQEAIEYQEQDPFEFEEQEAVGYHEHDEYDEETAQHQGASSENEDHSEHNEQPALVDAGGDSENTAAATAPVEMPEAPLYENVDDATREDVDLSNYDDNEDGLDDSPAQEDHTDAIGMDSTITEGEAATALDGQTADASSHNTSATATLNGDENDEIDYSDGEAEEVDVVKPHESISSVTLQEQADGDFIWESEDEDARKETAVVVPKQSAQVSPTTGKRARSGSDAAEDANAHASVRRRLS